MKTEKIFTDDHQVKITAQFEPELLDQFKRRAARKIAQNTRIPGFRPGKAPYNMILNHVGEATVTQEALELLLDDVYPKVLDQEEIKPWGPGNLDNIKSENPPIFEFTIPLEPEVVISGEDKLSKEYRPPVLEDEAIDDYINRMRRSYANIVPLDTAAEEGNVVYMTLEAKDLGATEDLDPILIKPGPHQALIPSENEETDNEWPFKGFARLLIGHKPEETFEFSHRYDSNDQTEEFSGKTLNFKISLQSVKGLELPEIDAEFLQNIGGYKSAEELRNRVGDYLNEQQKQEYQDTYYLELVDELRKNASIKYPPQMLEKEQSTVLENIEHDLSHRQLNLDLYLKLKKTDKEKFIEEEVKPTAKNRLERSLVMDALSKKYDLQVSNESLESEISNVVNGLISSGEFEEMQKQMGSKKFAQSVSMEAANRALESTLRRKLLSFADPQMAKSIEEEVNTTVVSDTKIEDPSEAENSALQSESESNEE